MIWQPCGRRGSGNPQKGFDVAVFVRMGLRAERPGVPGGAWGAKGSLWCPAGREKTGKKRGNPSRAGHGEQKEAFGAPPPKKKQGRREKIRAGRGTGSKRKPLVPRRQRKNREEEKKSEPGGAWRAKRSLWCPAAKEKTGKKRENPSRAGHREQKEALIPRLPSINENPNPPAMLGRME